MKTIEKLVLFIPYYLTVILIFPLAYFFGDEEEFEEVSDS